MAEEGNGVSDELNNGENGLAKTAGNAAQKGANMAAEKGKQVARDKVKKKIAKTVAKEGTKAAAKAGLGAALGAIMFWVMVVIVALIIIIGIIMFFVSMPGMLIAKLKAMLSEIAQAISAFFGADTTKQVSDEKLYGLMDYVEKMGWGLKDDGFLTDYVHSLGEYKEGTSPLPPNADDRHLDDMEGVIRGGSSDGNIVYAKSDFLFAYLVSENYLYTIKNFNQADLHWWQALGDHIVNLFTDDMSNRTGMIYLVHDGGGVGSSTNNSYDAIELGYIEVDPSAKVLRVKKGWTNGPMEFSLDGWVGRYGMPVDFLLAIHKATMMPDLAYDMTDKFKTEIRMLLHEGKGSVIAEYQGENGVVTQEEIEEAIMAGGKSDNIFSAIINWFDRLGTNVKEANTLVSMGIVPPWHSATPSGGGDYTGGSGLAQSDDDDDGDGHKCTCKTEKMYTDDTGAVYRKGSGEGQDKNKWYKYTMGSDGKYDDGVEVSGFSEEGKTELKGAIIELCSDCESYFNKVQGTMNSATDYNFSTYVPYIENVTDHWFRDVYFISSSGNNEFVQYDFDYEGKTKERWTLYETDENGDYKYYKWDEKNDTLSSQTYNPTVMDFISKNYKEEDLKSGDFAAKHPDICAKYDVTAEELTAMINSYDFENKVIFAKKAKTFDMKTEYQDYNWRKLSDNVYSAYDTDEGNYSASQSMQGTERYESAGEMEQQIMDRININISFGVPTQVGEGMRTQTNDKIKKMFLANNYFQYNGKAETAEIITAMRKYDKIPYGALSDDIYKKEYTFDQLASALPTEFADYKGALPEKFAVSDYAGKVSINQDAINEFSMLENEHTLDSDYIYRDFKELIVELGYFSRAELTDETPRLLEFPVPDIGSGLYPAAEIDKNDHDFGTAIHSERDILAHNQDTYRYMMSLLEGAGADDKKKDKAPSGIDQVSGIDLSNVGDITPKKDEFVVDQFTQMNHNVAKNEIGKIHPAGAKSVTEVSLEEFIKSTEKMCSEMQSVGYDYCVMRGCDYAGEEVACDHLEHGNDTCSKHSRQYCILYPTYEESKADAPNRYNVCCATLVMWSLKLVEVMPESDTYHGAESLAAYILANMDCEVINNGEELKEGDILCYSGHIDICGKGAKVKYNGGHVAGPVTGQKFIQDGYTPWSGGAQYAIRLHWGRQPVDENYKGYEGNEAVVSPVTGRVLAYGVYKDEKDSITDEEYRVNTDLQWGTSLDQKLRKEGKRNEDGVEQKLTGKDKEKVIETVNTARDDEGKPTNEIVHDKVGYIKIEVLTKKVYSLFEQDIKSKASHALPGGKSYISATGNVLDYEDLTGNLLDEKNTSDWTRGDTTLYGYKEFLQSYADDTAKIDGYVITIDGFVCEEPDEELIKKKEEAEENHEDFYMYMQRPNGDKITYPSYFGKITSSNVGSDSSDSSDEPDSIYEMDKEYKMASQKATDNWNIENGAKNSAAPTYKFSAGGETYYLVKEGTVIGRTMTDKELIENTQIRIDGTPGHNWDYYRPTDPTKEPKVDEETGLELIEDKVMGNYLRIVMRNTTDNTVVENVEEYMKLDEQVRKKDNDWELFYWLPFESGGTDVEDEGPENQGTCSSGETAVGLVQWTVLLSSNMNNITSQFIPGCLKENSSLCAPLAAYKSWSASQFWSDYCGGKQFKATLKSICSVDRDEFVRVQMEVAKKDYLEPILEDNPWLENRRSCVQGEVMHLKLWGAPRTKEIKDKENSTDEEIILWVRNVIANTGSTAGPASHDETKGRAYNEPQIGLDILAGKMSDQDIENWVRTGDPKYVKFKFRYNSFQTAS